MSIDQHIEELRAELRNAVDPIERQEIVAGLELALAKREALWAKFEAEASAEPPH